MAPKVSLSRLSEKLIFQYRSVNCSVSIIEGLKLKITAHETFLEAFANRRVKFDQEIRAGIKFTVVFQTDKHVTFDRQLQHFFFHASIATYFILARDSFIREHNRSQLNTRVPLLPGPSRRLAPVIKCRQFLSFFQRYIVRDISLT